MSKTKQQSITTSAEQAPKFIGITTGQRDELIDVLNAICELQMLGEHADDQPWTIL